MASTSLVTYLVKFQPTHSLCSTSDFDMVFIKTIICLVSFGLFMVSWSWCGHDSKYDIKFIREKQLKDHFLAFPESLFIYCALHFFCK